MAGNQQQRLLAPMGRACREPSPGPLGKSGRRSVDRNGDEAPAAATSSLHRLTTPLAMLKLGGMDFTRGRSTFRDHLEDVREPTAKVYAVPSSTTPASSTPCASPSILR